MVNNFDSFYIDPNSEFSEQLNEFSGIFKKRLELTRLILNELFTEVGIEKELTEIPGPADFLNHIEEIANSLENEIPALATEIRQMISLISIDSDINNDLPLENKSNLDEEFLDKITDQIFIDTMNHKLNNASQGMFLLKFIDTQAEELLEALKNEITNYKNFGIEYSKVSPENFDLFKKKFEAGLIDQKMTEIIQKKIEENGSYYKYLKNITETVEKIGPIIEKNCQDEKITADELEVDATIINLITTSYENVKEIIRNYKNSLGQFCKNGYIEVEGDFNYCDKIMCCLSEHSR